MTLATFPLTTQFLNGRLYVSSKSCCETNGIRRVTLNPFQSSMSYGQPLSTGWDRHRHLPPLVKISWLSTCLTLVQIQQNPHDVSKAGTKIISIHPMLQIHNPEHINFTGLRMAMEWPLNRHGRFLAVNIWGCKRPIDYPIARLSSSPGATTVSPCSSTAPTWPLNRHGRFLTVKS